MIPPPPPHFHPKTFEQLRSNIVGIDIEVGTLDGKQVPYVFLDNGASTPAFQHVMDVTAHFMAYYSGVHRGTGFKSLIATKIFDEAHTIAGGFVGADAELNTVIFVKNTTEAINKLANRCDWKPDDIVLTTLMEHHSNDLPWRKYAHVLHIGVDDLGYLDMDALKKAFALHRGHVRFLSVTGASNISGIVNPIHELAELAHANGALIVVDAAQLAPHRRIDIKANDHPGHIDFIAYSAHKMYAPFGIGVLIGSKVWFQSGDPDMVGGGVVEIVEEDFVAYSDPPAKEEAGSPNVPGAVGLATSIGILQHIGMDTIEQHEHELLLYAIKEMKEVPGLLLYGPTTEKEISGKVGVLTFSMESEPHAKVAAILSAEGGIGVRNGCFCAHPLVKRLLRFSEEDAKIVTKEILGGDRTHLPGMVRASFGCYNNFNDIDRLVEMLHRIARGEYSDRYVLEKASGSYWPKDFTYDYAAYFPYFSFEQKATLNGVCVSS